MQTSLFIVFESISISSQFPYVLCYNVLCDFVSLKIIKLQSQFMGERCYENNTEKN